MLKRSPAPRNAGRKITFVLPADHPAGRVSAVGTFNDWTPGAHMLRRRSNGTMSASVTVPLGSEIRFRFLGENGWWFDDEDADAITKDGSLIVA